MLRISKEADYGTRILQDMAERPDNERATTLEIADRQGVPRSLAPRVVQQLSKAGLVDSRPGRTGGLELTKPAHAITLKEIVEAFHGPIMVNFCLEGPGTCPRDAICPAHEVWTRIQVTIVKELEATTLASLADRAHALRAERRRGSD